ncbi:MAG: PAS domain S-box protein, partial [Desulfobacula sp.]|nr:PAS domain S-box protein [Desulfobacula sp.]
MKDVKIRLLLVEDDKVDQMAFERYVKNNKLPYDYTIAGSIAEAEKIIKSNSFDIIISDYMLGDGVSFELFDQFKNLPVIVTTGTGNEEVAVKAMKLGACDYLIKDPEGKYLITLPSTVELALKSKHNEKELRIYQENLESIVKEQTAELQAEIIERRQTEAALRESEANLLEAQNIAKMGRWELDLVRNHFVWSPSIFEIFEIDPKKFGARYEAFVEKIHPEDRGKVDQAYTDSLKHRLQYNIEHRLFMKDGRIKWVNEICKTDYDIDGQAIRSIGIVQDITEHKEAEKSLRSAFQLNESIISSSPIGLSIYNSAGNCIAANNAAANLFGGTKAQILQQNYHRIDSWKKSGLYDIALCSVQEKVKKRHEIKVKTTFGKTCILDIHLIPFSIENEPHLYIMFDNITERKLAEEKIVRFGHIFEDSLNEIYMFAPDTLKFIQVNRAAQNNLGYTMEELEKLTPLDLKPEITAESFTRLTAPLIKGERGKVVFETIHRRKDQSFYDVEVHLQLLKYDHKALFAAIILDITERKQAAAKIQHLNLVLSTIHKVNQLIVQEKNKDALIQKTCDILTGNRGYGNAWIVLLDEHGVYLNSAESGLGKSFTRMKKMLKKGELTHCGNKAVKKKEIVIIDDPTKDCADCPLSKNYSDMSGYSICLGHGDKIYGLLSVSVPDFLGKDKEEQDLFLEVGGDIGFALHNFEIKEKHKKAEEEKAQLEDQYRQAQKMESVGRLAGGVAHDFNNALSVIISTAELVIDDVNPTGQLREDLDEILMASKRAADITRQLLAFARKQTIAPEVLELNETVESVLKMLRRLIGEDIDFAWLPGPSLWPVKMDPSQIDQILANLCVNARDAIEGVGKVTIESENITFAEGYCADHAGFVPGEFIKLSVSDNGCGMDKEIQGNIFEPFYTTKDVDKGTGLGMATVYGIVKQNKGFINVYSEPGKGTTIKVYLPRHEGKFIEIHEDSMEKIPQGQGEIILVVEDDTSILKIMQKILKGLGYTVLTSSAPEK